MSQKHSISTMADICVGERIVWISDEDGPQTGTIMWLGTLNDESELMAGISFDNPVGNGCGSYNGIRYFEAPMDCALFVPVVGLIKAVDFLPPENTSLCKSSIHRKPQKYHVTDPHYAHEKDYKHSCYKMNNHDPYSEDVDSSELLDFIGPYGSNTSSEPSFQTPEEGSSSLDTQSGLNLDVGSVVEVYIDKEVFYGVIKWIGKLPDVNGKSVRMAGLEMDHCSSKWNNGAWYGVKYFNCMPGKGLFIPLSYCRKDSRFNGHTVDKSKQVFGDVESPIILGAVPPISHCDSLATLCGKFKGIQGHQNSCYLDATLFSMFTFTSVFDSLLYRPKTNADIESYDQIQSVLRDEIVNPLRTNLFVRADRLMKLRMILQEVTSDQGLTCDEKDPEEFLQTLLSQTLRADPLLKLSSEQEGYLYQLFLEKDENLVLPTVQDLFDQSFLASDIKLQRIPPCLIIQMPRFGKDFKMYSHIVPSLVLDISDVLQFSPRSCFVCGSLAREECRECFDYKSGLESTAFCETCCIKVHLHRKRRQHHIVKLDPPPAVQNEGPIPRVYLELFAVICIETSHYVSFVKAGSGEDAQWCFFDSMADRKGEEDGYNIPELVLCPDLPQWFSEERKRTVVALKDDKQLPEYVRRILCDAYICMYQSHDIAMYM